MILHPIFWERHHQLGAGPFCEGMAVGGDKTLGTRLAGLSRWHEVWDHDGKYTCAHEFSVIFPVS